MTETCAIIGQVVDPSGAPVPGAWVALAPESSATPVDVGGQPAVMVSRVVLVSDSDGMVRGELLSPADATWTVEVGVHGRFHGRRTGVVLPASGPVSLGWLLGLTGDQDPDAGEVVLAPDGLTYRQTATTTGGGVFATRAVVSADGRAYTITGRTMP